jgi:predicted transcriptional regulator
MYYHSVKDNFMGYYHIKTEKSALTARLESCVRRLRNLTIQEIFICNLKAYRKLYRVSQTKLAELCNSSTGYIGEIECGKCFPSVSMIERIAEALGIESWNLFKNEPINLSAKLAPTQKKEILIKANAALSKILNDF